MPLDRDELSSSQRRKLRDKDEDNEQDLELDIPDLEKQDEPVGELGEPSEADRAKEIIKSMEDIDRAIAIVDSVGNTVSRELSDFSAKTTIDLVIRTLRKVQRQIDDELERAATKSSEIADVVDKYHEAEAEEATTDLLAASLSKNKNKPINELSTGAVASGVMKAFGDESGWPPDDGMPKDIEDTTKKKNKKKKKNIKEQLDKTKQVNTINDKDALPGGWEFKRKKKSEGGINSRWYLGFAKKAQQYTALPKNKSDNDLESHTL